MAEAMAKVGELELCHETFGDRQEPAMLLVMGLGTQLLGWRAEFCEALAAEGFYVVRYDNRDIGRSTKFAAHRPPTPRELITRKIRNPAYTLRDMAADGAGLLDALDLGPAHVVGVSMGGMIAQGIAAHHPDHVRSLTSIMSTTGHRFTGQPALKVMPYFLRAPVTDREATIARVVALFEMVGSTGFERDEAELRAMIADSLDRDSDAAGSGRQLAAIMASGNRDAEVRSIRKPALVIHGTADRLVAPSGGKRTAKLIPGSELLMVEGMGHDLPRGAWPQLVEAIARHARAADAATPARSGAPT